MHLTLVSADPECHHAIDEVANLLNGHVTVVARAHHLYDSPGDLILWHVTESSAAIATHLAAFGRPIVLLVTRQQLGPLGGPLLREPLPSFEITALGSLSVCPRCYRPPAYCAARLLDWTTDMVWLCVPNPIALLCHKAALFCPLKCRTATIRRPNPPMQPTPLCGPKIGAILNAGIGPMAFPI